MKYTGLTERDVVKAKEKYGSNAFSKPKEKSVFVDIMMTLKEPLVLILILAGGLSFIVGEQEDAIGIFIAVLIGILIGRLTEGRSKKAAEALDARIDEAQVMVVRDGKKKQLPKKELVPGDVVHIETGDMIPADGMMLDAYGLKAREDMLTGESDQVEKVAGAPVFGGTLVGEGNGVMKVTAIGDATEMGKIAQNLNVEEEMTPLQLKLGKLGVKISTISSSIAFALFAYMVWQILREDTYTFDFSSWQNFMTSIRGMHGVFPSIKTAFIVSVGLIVAAVPEGLPMLINIILSLTMQRMSKINVLIRKKEACETIGSVSVICSDKTGTLTENKMKVQATYVDGRYIEGELPALFVDNCVLNATADLDFSERETVPTYIGSPTEGALIAHSMGPDYESRRAQANIIRKIPFDSSRKYMVTAVATKKDFTIFSKGAPEIILAQAGKELRNGVEQALSPARKKAILDMIEGYQRDGMRVLAFAYKKTPSEYEALSTEDFTGKLVFHGFAALSDPLREGVQDAIEIAREAGIETKILTGDHIVTAEAIGREIGIVHEPRNVVLAEELDQLTDSELKQRLQTTTVVARSMPETKLRIVRLLQEQGEVVAVTGDGINDAPALTKADVGIAMGIAGTEVTKGAADIILTDDNFKTIVEAIKWGRGIYNNFQRYIQFTLTVNVIAFSVMILSQIAGFPLPFTTIHLLWINIIMDGPPALALGLEPIRKSVMRRKPIPKSSPIINPLMIGGMAASSVYISVLLFLQMRFNFLGADLSHVTAHGNEFRTVMFSLFACLAIFNALNAREFGIVSVTSNFFANWPALLLFSGTLIMQILVTQFASGFFDVVPLTMSMWIRIILTGFTVVLFSEGLKLVIRVLNRSRKSKQALKFKMKTAIF